MYSQFYLFVLLLLACLSSQDILTANGALWTYPAQALDTTSDNPSQNDVWKIGDQRTLTWNNYVDNADSITINLIQAQDNGAGFATQVIKSGLPYTTTSFQWTVGTTLNIKTSPIFYLDIVYGADTANANPSVSFNITQGAGAKSDATNFSGGMKASMGVGIVVAVLFGVLA